MSAETGDILRALGRIEGHMDAFQADLALHSRQNAASMAELKVELTKRGDDHSQRISSLEHTRTDNKASLRTLKLVIGFVSAANLGLLVDYIMKLKGGS